MDFTDFASETLDNLVAFYSDNFKIEHNVEVGGEPIQVMAAMRGRQQRSMLGVPVKGMGPEACEYVFFLSEDCFDSGVMAKLDAVFLAAEKEYVTPSSDHAFTFLSAVVIAQTADKNSASTLKRYKLRRDYRENGWIASRVAVFTQDRTWYCNRDGADLKRMLQKVITL